MPSVLDPAQLARIEATHSGFLYQHLFAVGQLLLAAEEDRVLLVETDEDVEIRSSSEHIYAQVKNLSTRLQPSDVAPILKRFDQLRDEHRTGRRPGKAIFAIVSRSEPSPSLTTSMASHAWPGDVAVVTPESGRSVRGVPAWPSIPDAVQWTVGAAGQIPFTRLTPETLVWKLAAHVQVVATGKLYGGSHEVRFSDLPRLREQLDLSAEVVPAPPVVYRPQQNEPPIDTGVRVRSIVGVSGAGKTSWFSSSSAHLLGKIVFMRAVSGIVDVASWLVRNLAASLLRNANETLSAVFRPGAVAAESLGLLDRLAAVEPITVVVDNAHLLDPAALAASIRETSGVRWILLSQPGPQTSSLLGRLQVEAEQLGGWTPTTIANVLADHGIACSPELALRVQDLTAGLPLFIEGTARVAKKHYEGDLARLLDEQSRGAHVARLPQEQIVADDVVRHLTADAKAVGAILAQLRSDVPFELARRVATDPLSLGQASPSAVRELTEWHILRPGPGGSVGVHDAFRPALDAERGSMDGTARVRCLKFLLDALTELRGDGEWSVDMLMDTLRLLADLGDGRTLVDVIHGGIEWLREYGAAGEAELLLTEAMGKSELSDEFLFLGADTLAYLAIQNRDLKKAAHWISLCEQVAKRQPLIAPEWEARLVVKRILLSGVAGNFNAAKAAFDAYERWAEKGTEGYRVARYDLAVAAYNSGEPGEAHRLTTELIAEYFEVLDLSPQKLFAKNIPDLLNEISIDGNEDEIRHLADAMQLRATVLVENGDFPGFDPPWAMKLYALVHADSSAMRAGLEWANATIRAGDISAGLKIFEDQLVPLLERERFMGWLVPVYLDYARALTSGGRFEDALARLKAVEVFAPALAEGDRELFDRVASTVQAADRRLGHALVNIPEGVRRIDRQRYDDYQPFRHPAASRIHEELAWFERDDRTAIGFIARDKVDDDYAWMVQREEDGQFSADNFKVSIESPEAAARELMDALLKPVAWSSVGDPDARGTPSPAGEKARSSLGAERQRAKDKRKAEKAARKKNRKR